MWKLFAFRQSAIEGSWETKHVCAGMLSRLDLYMPPYCGDDTPKPVVIFVTGGAWIIGLVASLLLVLGTVFLSSFYCFHKLTKYSGKIETDAETDQQVQGVGIITGAAAF